MAQQGKLNLWILCDALGSIAHKWFKIGVQLGIPRSKLEEFKKDDDPFSAVIDHWLKGNADGPPITWDTIVKILKSKHVDESGLAEEISKEYCQPKGSEEATAVEDNHQSQEGNRVEKGTSLTVTSQSASPSLEGKMNPDTKRDLTNILQRNLKEIVSEFASYVDFLRIAITEKGVTVDDLRSYLLSVPATSQSSKGQTLFLLSDKETQLLECKAIIDIFNLLKTKCSSFLDYDIFQFIQKRYGISSNIEQLQYPEHLKAYINKHKISEFAKVNPLLKPKNGSKELILKFDVETMCNLAKLIDLKKWIAEILKMSSLALEIISIEEGCVVVKFHIPASVANALLPSDTVFTPQQQVELQAASVLWLKCNDYSLYERKNEGNISPHELDKLKDLLTCSICLSTYIDPRQLQCQHSFCQQCLVKLLRQDQQGQPTLTCPTCRQVTPVPAGGVAAIPADFRTNQLLEVKPLSHIVDKDSSLPKPIASISNAHRIAASHEKTPFNCRHHEIQMEVFCETCREPICWKCQFKGGKHRDHECETLEKAYSQSKEDILTYSKAIEQALARFDKCHEEILNQQAAIEAEVSSITADSMKIELLSQLHQLTQAKLKDLAAKKDEIETIQVQLNSISDLSNRDETMLMQSTTVKQFRALATTFQHDTFEPCTKADLMLSHLPIGEEQQMILQVHDGTRPDPTKCFIRGQIVEPTVGGTASILIETLNFKSQPCKVPVSSINCELISDQASSSASDIEIEREPGQYKISYHPIATGKHQLHIKVEGQHIKGSPFSVDVKLPSKQLGTPVLVIDGVQEPEGVAVNSNGEIFVTESKSHCVTVFSPAGERLRSFGSHGSGQGQFENPYDLAFDGEKNILVTDQQNHRIQKFTSEGKFLASVGNYGHKPLEFDSPRGIMFNASNSKVYVVDEACRIQVLNSDLSYSSTFGKKGSGKGEFSRPRRVACDSSGNVYVTDYHNHNIQVFSAEGKFQRVFWEYIEGREELRDPYGLAIDSSDQVYFSDWRNNKVFVYNPDGELMSSFGSLGSKEGQFNVPRGLAVDSSGAVYVCDQTSNRIQVF